MSEKLSELMDNQTMRIKTPHDMINLPMVTIDQLNNKGFYLWDGRSGLGGGLVVVTLNNKCDSIIDCVNPQWQWLLADKPRGDFFGPFTFGDLHG